MNDVLKEEMLKYEDHLKEYASRASDAIFFKEYISDIRPAYFRDVDKIIHTTAYTRYLDKTQVFSLVQNDNITKRIIHVSIVSKLARTIGRALSLNEDLLEAIALGHDLGHVPFGHVGERILNDLSLEYDNTYFNHNVQSVRLLMDLENDGKGLNISLQTLDGILCHNGEMCFQKYEPKHKTKEEFLKEYNDCYTEEIGSSKLVPMTLEGCVVRICDIIAYIGRDIEDAIRLGIITKEDLPKEVVEVLGDNNSSIVNNLLMDVIENSYNLPYIVMSDRVFNALKTLKDFNSENIYKRANSKEQIAIIKNMFTYLFTYYLDHIDDKNCDINLVFLDAMDESYKEKTSKERKVIDYLSGMTDEFFMSQYNKYKL